MSTTTDRRLLTTVAEMDALPAGSLVMDACELAWFKLDTGEWTNGASTEESEHVLWQMPDPSATVVFDPSIEVAT